MKVTITSGPTRVEVENGDAENIRDLLAIVRDELNIPDGATALVDGVPATDETPLYDGAEVAFNKPTGQKG
jgi:hypothetical protein